MSFLRLSRLSGILSAQRVITHPSGALRFASAASSKSARSPPPLAYKGRIPRPEPAEPAESAEDIAAVQAASERLAQLPPVEEKREKTKEEKYKSTSTKITLIMIFSPIMIVTSYYLYRRLFLGDKRKKLTLFEEASE